MYTFCFIVGNIIQKSIKCIHSATEFRILSDCHYKMLIGLIRDGCPILKVLVTRSCIRYFRVFVGAGRGTARGTSTFAYMTD